MTRALVPRFPGELPCELTGFVISSRTVDAHIASIYGKLGISSRVQLVTWLGAQSGGPPGDSG
jgi:Bacterial regulatory proteins, luxR family